MAKKQPKKQEIKDKTKKHQFHSLDKILNE